MSQELPPKSGESPSERFRRLLDEAERAEAEAQANNDFPERTTSPSVVSGMGMPEAPQGTEIRSQKANSSTP